MKNEPVEEPKKLSDFYDKDHKYKRNKEKKIYKIACDWSVFSTMEIEASSLKEAMEIADDYPLPTDTDYVDGSFQIDKEMTQDIYDLEHDIR